MMKLERVSTENAPKAIGPYSQAVQVGNTIYLSGQVAINPATGKMVADDIKIKLFDFIDKWLQHVEDYGRSESINDSRC